MVGDWLKLDRVEFAGSLGDLGTMLPLLIPLVVINGINATIALLLVGLFYVGAGLYYKIPIPVQPLKVVAAIAITGGLPATVIAASGLLMGCALLFLAATGLINRVARVFSKPVIRGIQVALGLLLFIKGVKFLTDSKLLISGETASLAGLPLNVIIGLTGLFVAALLIRNERLPAAIPLVTFGFLAGLAFKAPNLTFGPQVPIPQMPTVTEFQTALLLLLIPQIPLTLSNATFSTSDLAKRYFGRRGTKASPKALVSSMGVANLVSGTLGGIPMCHGAGGLAAHYRFGARTGSANLMIGGIFIVMALIFGSGALSIFELIPLSILGVLLVFTGIELMILAVDVKDKRDFVVVSATAGLTVTINLTVAFMVAIVLSYLMRLLGRARR